jgi:hypothetical protein
VQRSWHAVPLPPTGTSIPESFEVAANGKCLRAVGGFAPLTYRHELNAIKLQEIPFFVSLLEDIRNHLLLSESTQIIYATIAEQFFFALDPAIRDKLRKPTRQDFYNYVFYHWPTFSSYQPPFAGGVLWGWVGKGDLEPNEVNISSDIVMSAAVSLNFSNINKSNFGYRLGTLVATFLSTFTG